MEGNSEEDYLDSLLDSVSVIKDDVVEDELYDEETNELIGALNDIMGDMGDFDAGEGEADSGEEPLAQEIAYDNEAALEDVLTGNVLPEAGQEEPPMPELVMDDELKALLGEDSAELNLSMPDGEGLTPEQADRLSQMDMESELAQEELMAEAMPEGSEDALSLDDAMENGIMWDAGDEAGGEMTENPEAVAEGEEGGKAKKEKASLFSKLFGKKKDKQDNSEEDGEAQEAAPEKKPKKEKKAKAKKEKKANKQQGSGEETEVIDENEHVLNQLFDEDGQLIEKEKKEIKKKSFFSNLIEKIKEEDEEDEPEPPKEKKEKKSKKSKKGAGKGDEQGEGEEGAGAGENPKKGKKEKKAKKPKASKPKKEKKPKEPPKPSEMVKFSKAGVIVMLVCIAGISGFAYIGTNTYHYNNSITSAMEYLVSGNYEKAFAQIDGLKLRTEEDRLLYEQITVIMYVEKKYDSFLNLRKMGMEYEALDSLIQGIKRYYEFRETGEDLTVLSNMDEVKDKIVHSLELNYGISEALALTYSEIEDPIQYYYIINSYGSQ